MKFLEWLFKAQIEREAERVKIHSACDLPSKALSRLRDLTERLSARPYEAIVSSGFSTDFYTVKDQAGNKDIYAFPIYKDPQVNIERAWMEKGAITEKHFHADEMQHIVLITGKIIVHCERANKKVFKKEIGPGECVYFPVGRVHFIEAVENCHTVNVNISLALIADSKYNGD